MKLLTRTNIYFLALTLLVFSLGGEVFFQRVHAINKSDANERLEDEKNKVIDYIKTHHSLPINAISLGDSLAFYPTAGIVEEKIAHTKVYNASEKEYEPYQTIVFGVSVSDRFYKAVISRPLLESDDITAAIAQAIAIIATCLIILLLLSNFIISKIVWLPFYKALEKIKSFDLTQETEIDFTKTNIKEFKMLNEVLGSMTKKISSDYRNLKEFTENASHELQTPLAIIQSKLELLIQSDNLTEKQMEEVQVVYESAGRLSKLNQALLLLTKIENKQFSESSTVAINDLIKNKLTAFDELLKHKGILVEKHLTQVSLQMHPALADILVTNLIGNAIKHNVNSGKIVIDLNGKQLFIKNTGRLLTGSPQDLFERFRKADGSSESLGLGLAIVKEICKMYEYEIRYEYANGIHNVMVSF